MLLPEARGQEMDLKGGMGVDALEHIDQIAVGLDAVQATGRQQTLDNPGNGERKGKPTLVYRTLFGSFHLPSPRFYRCRCQPQGPHSFSPLAQLLTERTAPELLYLETKWAALIPYRATSELLADVLPFDHTTGVCKAARILP